MYFLLIWPPSQYQNVQSRILRQQEPSAHLAPFPESEGAVLCSSQHRSFAHLALFPESEGAHSEVRNLIEVTLDWLSLLETLSSPAQYVTLSDAFR